LQATVVEGVMLTVNRFAAATAVHLSGMS